MLTSGGESAHVHFHDGQVMHQPVHGSHRHGLVREDFVPRRERRIGREGTALDFLALGDQLKQRGGPDLGAPGLGMTDASHQMCPAKCTRP